MALDLCFFNKECIRKREEERAKNEAIVQQQQMLLGEVAGQTKSISPLTIVAIVVGLAAITITIFLIKKYKKK